jgi:hypothetical protein
LITSVAAAPRSTKCPVPLVWFLIHIVITYRMDQFNGSWAIMHTISWASCSSFCRRSFAATFSLSIRLVLQWTASVGWCVFSRLQQVPRRIRPSVGVIHRRQKTGRLDKDSFLGRREQNAHLPPAERCSRLSSNQRQSHPQKTVRLDKHAFLGRQPVLNRTHVSRQRLEDARLSSNQGYKAPTSVRVFHRR